MAEITQAEINRYWESEKSYYQWHIAKAEEMAKKAEQEGRHEEAERWRKGTEFYRGELARVEERRKAGENPFAPKLVTITPVGEKGEKGSPVVAGIYFPKTQEWKEVPKEFKEPLQKKLEEIHKEHPEARLTRIILGTEGGRIEYEVPQESLILKTPSKSPKINPQITLPVTTPAAAASVPDLAISTKVNTSQNIQKATNHLFLHATSIVTLTDKDLEDYFKNIVGVGAKEIIPENFMGKKAPPIEHRTATLEETVPLSEVEKMKENPFYKIFWKPVEAVGKYFAWSIEPPKEGENPLKQLAKVPGKMLVGMVEGIPSLIKSQEQAEKIAGEAQQYKKQFEELYKKQLESD